nr:gustatory receptor 25 [Papilio polytes]
MEAKRHTIIEDINACIVKSMKPLLCIEYCYGIFRCRLSGRYSEAIDLRMKMIGIAITITWVTVFFFAIGYSIESLKQLMQQDKVIFILTGFTYAGSSIVFVFFHTQKYHKAVEILAKVDIALFANIDQKIYKMSIRQCKILLILHVLHCVASLALSAYFPEGFNKILLSLFSLIYCENKIEMYVFCQFLYMLKQRLLLIRKYLSKLNFDRNHDIFMVNTKSLVDFNFIGHISNTNYKIRDLACAYSKIGKVSMLINEIYNGFLLSTLAMAFFYIILAVWSNLYGYTYDKSCLCSFSTMFYVLVEILSIILLSCFCENVIAARNDLNNLLFRITTQENLPLSMRYQAKVFMKLTEIWNLSIKVFDTFEVNLSIILKLFSICTTYLIVVIQVYRLV